MPKLPVISGDRLVAALRRAGFSVVRQRGSHVSLSRTTEAGETHRTVVPLHRELAAGTLMDILQQCGLSKDDLIGLIRD